MEFVMAIKEKKVELSIKDKDNKDIVSLMEDYFGCPAMPIDEFESIDATEQFAITFTKE